MKALDYMAHGKAILASDLGEIREILTDEDALMLPPGDAAAWADAIEHLDRETITTLGAAAKARLADSYNFV